MIYFEKKKIQEFKTEDHSIKKYLFNISDKMKK